MPIEQKKHEEIVEKNLGFQSLGLEGEAKRQKQIKLTNRDLEVLEFCLEMKFSDLKSIHQKFFFHLQSGNRSKSDWWARERLGILKRHGYLNSKRISFSGSSYYLATDLAHMALSSLRPSRSFVRPLAEIDVRTFEHDRRVIEARLVLESLGRANNWCSERRLKSESSLTSGLPRMYQPDAIYQNKLGELMAFELELSVKTKDRYEDKIRKYVDVIRKAETGSPGFLGVLFVVCSYHSFNILNELTRRFEGKFKIEKYNELIVQGSKIESEQGSTQEGVI